MSFSLQNGTALFAPTQATQACHATTFGTLMTPGLNRLAPAFGPGTDGT